MIGDRHFDVLVLVAQDKDGHLHDYVLPPKVVREHWKKFDRNGKNVVIPVKRSFNNIFLLTNEVDLPIQQYEGNYAPLE
jgi:hypothetical protein